MTQHNWAGNLTFSAADVVAPKTVEDLQDLVASHEQVRALGSRHSFSTVADTTGLLIDTAELDLSIDIDPAALRVTVPAGVRYGELAVALEGHGLAMGNLGSLPHISVAGACATGTHGSGDTNRCLASAVVGLEFVAADGTVAHLTDDDPSFAGSVVALGALGVVTRVTLAVEPSYEIRQDVWQGLSVTTLTERLPEILGAGYSVSAFTRFPDPDTVDTLWIKSRTDTDPVDASVWGARPATLPAHPIDGIDPVAATEQLGVPGRWHERLPHFRLSHTPSNGDEQQTEYLVPREHGADAVRALARLDLSGLQVFELRSVAADELWLSPASGRDSVALHFTWINDDRVVDAALAQVEDALAPFSPRPHWGKRFRLSADTVRAQYPRLADFAALAARYDPARKFGNRFLHTYVYPQSRPWASDGSSRREFEQPGAG